MAGLLKLAGARCASPSRHKAVSLQCLVACLLQLDPKEEAKKKAAVSRAETKLAKMAEQAQGTRKISAFFTARKK